MKDSLYLRTPMLSVWLLAISAARGPKHFLTIIVRRSLNLGTVGRRADERDAEAGQLQSRLKAAEKELAKLQKQEEATRTEMLVP